MCRRSPPPLGGLACATPDAAGNVYFSLAYQNTIMKLDVTTGMLSVVAGNGSGSVSGDGPADLALDGSGCMVFDSKGNLYFGGRNRIHKLANGVVTTIAGTGEAGFGGDNGLRRARS